MPLCRRENPPLYHNIRDESYKENSMNENQIGSIILDCAFNLHRKLGPGLLESVYETVLAKLLESRGLSVKRQVSIPIVFDGLHFDEGFRADIIVHDRIILELKCIENVNNSHKKQLLTYLKLTNLKLGYLLNFNEAVMKNGIIRIINGDI